MRWHGNSRVFPDTCPGKETAAVLPPPGWGLREEKSVPKRTEGASRSPGRGPDAAAPPPLPDLTGVTLRALRTCDDPAVTAAVESALSAPEELSRVWRSSGTNGGGGKLPRSGVAQPNSTRAAGQRGVIRSTFDSVHDTFGPPPGTGDSVGRHERL